MLIVYATIDLPKSVEYPRGLRLDTYEVIEEGIEFAQQRLKELREKNNCYTSGIARIIESSEPHHTD